jgi:hypothetical protein
MTEAGNYFRKASYSSETFAYNFWISAEKSEILGFKGKY